MTDRFVCSAASVAREEGVSATASQVRGWLLVEVHGAWGRDAVYDSHLGAHLPEGWKADLQLRGIRPICIRPSLQRRPEDADAARVFFVQAARPGRTEGIVWTRTLPTLAAVRHVTGDLRLGAEPAGWTRHPERIVLVCANGKHDPCCATEGRPVVRHLRESRWADQVWECSHIGGDRFAANLVVLPDSLYFGRMEPAEAEALLDDHADGQIALDWFRGRSTHRWTEQAAEQELRRSLDVRGIDDISFASAPDGERVRAEVRGAGTFDVAVERTVQRLDGPLTCHGRAGQDVPTYTVTEVTPVDGPGVSPSSA
jgi:hypothetical protein